MEANYSLFKYFKGEKENPFDKDKQNAQFIFWEYEKTFDDLFNKADFNPSLWVVPFAEDIAEWNAILKSKPVNKVQLFELWLYRLLMEHLTEKYQSENDKFLRLYYDSEV